jgi:hypothetical protein
MERLNNWMTYSFDDGPINGPKPSAKSVFKIHFKKGLEYQRMSYYDALYYNARMLKDNYSEPFDVLFSGGIDSEIILRIFKEEGIRHNVYTIRMEDDINIRDLNDAKNICNELGVKLNILDWNLQKFFDNDAYDMYQKTFSPAPGRMLRHAWFDLLDNIPVMGEGEPYWKRELGGDHSQKSKWNLYFAEDYFTASIYGNTFGRTTISEWYNYTPEVVMNYHKLPLAQRLINDEIPGKQSSWSSRREIHKTIWPTIPERPKLYGYEGPDGPVGFFPKCITDFIENIVAGTSNYEYRYSEKDLETLFN